MRRSMLGALCALMAAAGAAHAEGLEPVREKGVLRVAVYKDFPPYSYSEGGSYRGLDVDLGKALAAKMGVAMALVPIPASDESMEDDLRNAVWKGHYMGWGGADVMLHVPVSADFQRRVDQVSLFAPYYRELIAVAHRSERIPELASLSVFRSEKVGVEMRTVADQFLITTDSGAYIGNVVHFRSFDAACKAFGAGELAALAAQRGQLEHCLGAERRGVAISAMPAPNVKVFEWNVGMAVKADATDLREALAAALAALRADGTLQAVFDKHHMSLSAPVGG